MQIPVGTDYPQKKRSSKAPACIEAARRPTAALAERDCGDAKAHTGGNHRAASGEQEPGALRIALLGYRSHPHVGGQGIYIKYLAKALADAGHQVTVVSGPPYPELDTG
ncbi:MAG: hypothetical protein WBN40_12135, partial [Pseudomonadales bacterium]